MPSNIRHLFMRVVMRGVIVDHRDLPQRTDMLRLISASSALICASSPRRHPGICTSSSARARSSPVRAEHRHVDTTPTAREIIETLGCVCLAGSRGGRG
jgi:hypothetical protein